jgi:hypothetical protein
MEGRETGIQSETAETTAKLPHRPRIERKRRFIDTSAWQINTGFLSGGTAWPDCGQ